MAGVGVGLLTAVAYGARAPRVQAEGYKKSNRNQIAEIAQGNVTAAIAWYEKELDKRTNDLYDAMSSKLTNNKSHSLVEGAIFGYNEKCSFGWLTFDTRKDDPELTYDIVNIEDEVMHSKTFKLSQLSFSK